MSPALRLAVGWPVDRMQVNVEYAARLEEFVILTASGVLRLSFRCDSSSLLSSAVRCCLRARGLARSTMDASSQLMRSSGLAAFLSTMPVTLLPVAIILSPASVCVMVVGTYAGVVVIIEARLRLIVYRVVLFIGECVNRLGHGSLLITSPDAERVACGAGELKGWRLGSRKRSIRSHRMLNASFSVRVARPDADGCQDLAFTGSS